MYNSIVTPSHSNGNDCSPLVGSTKTALPAALALALCTFFALAPAAMGKDKATGQPGADGLAKAPMNLLELPPYPTRIVPPWVSIEYVGKKCVLTFRVDT